MEEATAGEGRGSGTGCGWQPVPSGEEGGWALALGRAVTAATFDTSEHAELGRVGRKQTKEASALPAGKKKVRCVGYGRHGWGWKLSPGGFSGTGPGVGM